MSYIKKALLYRVVCFIYKLQESIYIDILVHYLHKCTLYNNKALYNV